jgi:hypothetical protein
MNTKKQNISNFENYTKFWKTVRPYNFKRIERHTLDNTWLFIFILLFLDFCLIFGCCASARIYGDLYVRMCADLHASVRACFHVVVCYAAFMLNICVMALVICCGMLLRLHSECWGHQRTHSWWIVLALRSLFQIREHLKFIFFFLIVFFFIRFGKVVNPIP